MVFTVSDTTNGITITKTQVSFWGAVLVAIASIAGAWYGASRPQQPTESATRQQTMLDDQKTVILELQKTNITLNRVVEELQKKK